MSCVLVSNYLEGGLVEKGVGVLSVLRSILAKLWDDRNFLALISILAMLFFLWHEFQGLDGSVDRTRTDIRVGLNGIEQEANKIRKALGPTPTPEPQPEPQEGFSDCIQVSREDATGEDDRKMVAKCRRSQSKVLPSPLG